MTRRERAGKKKETKRMGTTRDKGRIQGRMALWLLAALITLISAGLASAQQTLADADWFERPLGDGVVWRHYLFDNLFGGKQSVSYIEVDLGKAGVSVEFPYLAASRAKTSSMISSQFPAAVAGVNGTYFDTTGTGGHRTYLRVNNTEIPPGGALFSSWGYDSGVAIDASDVTTVIQRPAGGWSTDTTHPDILACGPMLIIDTVIPTATLSDPGFTHCASRHPRSAVGKTSENRLILLTVDGRTDMANGMTCVELAQVMQQLGCANALNLDGGGSTTLWGKGEPYNGVLNYPSDNSAYDHAGERSCSNAIAIVASTTDTLAWDGRVTGKTFSGSMNAGETQNVTLTFQNCGTQTWTAANTKLVLARPAGRASELYDASTWVSPSQPALMTPATVGPGQTATFTFKLKAPNVVTTTVYDEHFMLVQSGITRPIGAQSGDTRIGPADSECWMRIVAEPPASGGASFIVESRSGGQNYAWYSDSGFADSGTNCTATGCTGNIGMRYGSTYRSVAGAKTSTTAPNFPGAGEYKVYVAWGAGSNRRNPITYKVNHAAGQSEFQIDQSAVSNVWIQLGTEPFYFNSGYSGSVVISNEDIDISGSMYAGAVKFEFVESAVDEWTLY